jgi:23S rRNA (guanosine2251-2'-O)-methyltransferase
MKDTRAGKSDRKPWQKGPGAKRPGGHPGKHSGGRSGGSGEPGRGRQPPVARRDMPDDGIVRIFGSHAVEAALNNRNRRVIRLLATENAEIRLAEVIAARRVLIDRATPGDLDHLLGADTVHQGLLLEAQPLEEPLLAELIARAKTHGPLVLLDHVTDPHNFGAVLRSAAAFGTAGLIMTRRHSPPLNGVLAKAASGALDLVPVLPVQNLAKTMEELRRRASGSSASKAHPTRGWKTSPSRGRAPLCSEPKARACASSPRKRAIVSFRSAREARCTASTCRMRPR